MKAIRELLPITVPIFKSVDHVVLGGTTDCNSRRRKGKRMMVKRNTMGDLAAGPQLFASILWPLSH